MHKQQRWLQAWEYCQVKLIQTLGRASQGVNWSWSQSIKSHHVQISSGKGLPSHFWNRNNVRSIFPGLKRKITGLLLSGPKLKFCIIFGNQGPRVWRKCGEAQNPCCLKSSVKFPQSVMIWGAVTSAGVGPLCFIKSRVNLAIYQEILEYFMLPSADKHLWCIVKRNMRDTRPNIADDLKAAIKVTLASLHLSSATGWLPPCHAALMQ